LSVKSRDGPRHPGERPEIPGNCQQPAQLPGRYAAVLRDSIFLALLS